jgi:hypothetical protein
MLLDGFLSCENTRGLYSKHIPGRMKCCRIMRGLYNRCETKDARQGAKT